MMGTMKRYACFGIGLAFAAILSAQAPSVVDGGVLNSASFAKDANGRGSAVAPGSLISIFGTFTGATLADADSVPFSTSLGGVSVTFNNIPAPLLHVIPAAGFVSAQMPFGIPSSGTVNVAVTINQQTSVPKPIPVVPAAPGIFTYPADGQSNAILVFLDTDGKAKIAAPPSAAISQVYPTAPIPLGYGSNPGDVCFLYATGLGVMTPAVVDGGGGLEPPIVEHDANAKPTVLIGGLTAQVLYAGQAPGYPGVNQINIIIPTGVAAGDKVSLQLRTADGTITSSSSVTVAIRANR
jgi:uncharacterized protein (TIGR03437 family)